MKDKIHSLYRILDMREWADRTLFFLGRWYELETELVLKALLNPSERVLDVGANYGHFSMAAASYVGTEGSVIAVEPNPYSFGRLASHVSINDLSNVEILNIGMSDFPGQLSLQVPDVNSGEATFGKSAYKRAELKEFQCTVKTGDTVLEGSDVEFIKIDTEGFECHVLRGLSHTIKRCLPMIFLECVSKHLTNAGSSADELYDMMHRFGYVGFIPSLFRPSALSKHRLRLERTREPAISSDILWIHSSKLESVPRILFI
jgi:FkbM family methyltransferase